MFGTPVFTTLGGQSKCPGESGTLARESNVKIKQIKARCGADSNSPCDPAALSSITQPATFAVQIVNLSPTGNCEQFIIRI